jgi:hypothetical protein
VTVYTAAATDSESLTDECPKMRSDSSSDYESSSDETGWVVTTLSEEQHDCCCGSCTTVVVVVQRLPRLWRRHSGDCCDTTVTTAVRSVTERDYWGMSHFNYFFQIDSES